MLLTAPQVRQKLKVHQPGRCVMSLSALGSRLSALFAAIAVGLLMLVAPSVSLAQVVTNCSGNANEAPAAYNAGTCHGVCAFVGSELVCDTNNWCTSGSGDNVSAYAAQDFNAAGLNDFSIYGSCLTEGVFCCLANDNMMGTVNKVTLIGTPSSNDDLFFEDAGNRMRNHRAYHVDGFIRAGGGNDSITGSPFNGSNYRDNLYGEGGDDSIFALDGDDWVSGGPGNDVIDLGAGDDMSNGDDGDDSLTGGAGHDTMCDSAVNSDSSCVANGGTFFDGGADNDTLYYDGWLQCPGSDMDAASTAGLGANDTCGDLNFVVQPNSCTSTLGTGSGQRPAGCDDPN
jgi:hypothetical protein